jgi:hypothetical protein
MIDLSISRRCRRVPIMCIITTRYDVLIDVYSMREALFTLAIIRKFEAEL